MKKVFFRISSLFLVLAMFSTWSIAFAAEPSDQKVTSIETVVSDINGELQASGTSIEAELYNLRSQYRLNALQAETTSDREHWLNLAAGVDTLIADYANYRSSESDNIMPQSDPINDAYLKTAVAAVVTWFSSKRYFLSAELLVTARNNDDESHVYIPSNQDIIRNSSVVKGLIKSGRPSGSGEFSSSGEMDLYYSIHLFRYEKKNNVFILTDTYDYEHGDQSYGDSIADVAVNTMADAQSAGIIVPYTVRVRIPY